jgi:endonuclease/exonuclease/phosphatase family metal-dependent hydrolase
MMFTVMCLICLQVSAQKKETLRVASYNLRFNNPNDGENAWPNRKENVKALVLYHDFDVFGTQECLIGQLKDLGEMSGYAWYGIGREDGKEAGEHSAVFYKKDRFKLLASGSFWLSETPDAPKLGWDGCCFRICSWVKLKDVQTRKTFYFFNLHFDLTETTKRESGKLMVQKIKEIAQDAPVICTGDFNSTPETEQIQHMQTLLNDSYQITRQPPYGPVGTFNGFKFEAPMKHRIDYVFVSKGLITVLKYGVLTDAKAQRYPSDHLPVVVDLKLK